MAHHNDPLSKRPSSKQTIVLALAAAAASVVSVTAASAQAWLPPPRSGSLDVTYARSTATHHLFSREVLVAETGEVGKSVSYGEEYSNIEVLSVDFGLSDRFAIRADVSYVSSRYEGLPPWQEGELDNGTYHGALTDYRAELRYAAVRKHNFVFTPFAGVVVPSHPYQTEGHAAPGRGSTQIPIGVGLGYTWPRPVHTTYAQARYAYAFLQTNGYDFSRSNAFIEAGTYLARWCSIRGLVGGEKTHGGIDWFDIDTPDEFETHDARTSSRYLSAAVGVSFTVSRTVALAASYSQILGGANIVDTKSFWVSATWYFGGAGEKLIGKSR